MYGAASAHAAAMERRRAATAASASSYSAGGGLAGGGGGGPPRSIASALPHGAAPRLPSFRHADRPRLRALHTTCAVLLDMLGDDKGLGVGDALFLPGEAWRDADRGADAVADAREYAREEILDACAKDARARGIAPGVLSTLILELLRELDDSLLTGKLHEAFAAAVKIKDYRSRLYVTRLLLDRLPADRRAALDALVRVLARVAPRLDAPRSPSSSRATSSSRDVAMDAKDYDALVKTMAPGVLRRKGGGGGSPPKAQGGAPGPRRGLAADILFDGIEDGKRAAKLLKDIVRERLYLLDKAAVVVGEDDDGYAAGSAASAARKGGKERGDDDDAWFGYASATKAARPPQAGGSASSSSSPGDRENVEPNPVLRVKTKLRCVLYTGPHTTALAW